jgi:hypothetical protein
MRSDLVFGALAQVSNRYRLCRLATKATRKLHRPYTRLQDTINHVLIHFEEANPEKGGARSESAAHPIAWRGNRPADLDAEFRLGFPPMDSAGDLRSMKEGGSAIEVEM